MAVGTAKTKLRGNPTLRAADRFVGIPLVVAGGALRRRRKRPGDVRRIGIINSANIGDTILLSGVLADIGGRFPRARIILFTSSATAALGPTLPGVESAVIDFARPPRAVSELRSHHLDVLLDFDQWPRVEAVLCMLSGARWTAGFRSPKQYRHYAYDAWADHSAERHELDNYRELVTLLGIRSQSPPRLVPSGALAPSDRPSHPYAVLHMWPTGVRSELKEWPEDRWRELAARLTQRGWTLVITGSPVDSARTRAFVASCGARAGAIMDAAGTYDLAQLVDLLAASHCVVSVNTGIMHMAAATGAPTVSLNGPTSEHRWGPVGPRAVSVNSAFDGCGYLHYGSEYAGQREDCMLGISVDAVLAAVDSVIDAG